MAIEYCTAGLVTVCFRNGRRVMKLWESWSNFSKRWSSYFVFKSSHCNQFLLSEVKLVLIYNISTIHMCVQVYMFLVSTKLCFFVSQLFILTLEVRSKCVQIDQNLKLYSLHFA